MVINDACEFLHVGKLGSVFKDVGKISDFIDILILLKQEIGLSHASLN